MKKETEDLLIKYMWLINGKLDEIQERLKKVEEKLGILWEK